MNLVWINCVDIYFDFSYVFDFEGEFIKILELCRNNWIYGKKDKLNSKFGDNFNPGFIAFNNINKQKETSYENKEKKL